MLYFTSTEGTVKLLLMSGDLTFFIQKKINKKNLQLLNTACIDLETNLCVCMSFSAKPISLVERCYCRSTVSNLPRGYIRELRFIHTPNCPFQVMWVSPSTPVSDSGIESRFHSGIKPSDRFPLYWTFLTINLHEVAGQRKELCAHARPSVTFTHMLREKVQTKSSISRKRISRVGKKILPKKIAFTCPDWKIWIRFNVQKLLTVTTGNSCWLKNTYRLVSNRHRYMIQPWPFL